MKTVRHARRMVSSCFRLNQVELNLEVEKVGVVPGEALTIHAVCENNTAKKFVGSTVALIQVEL